ncbi:1-deoxy-D-xylulose-5-phosphate reductoisomerase [Millisia brevis]|uniref:1-deoxy-D-xylulose-5-phosphate reductoisomerase n=1 Tax=Millisia brevis TaxID=264148 RepID=UPI00082BBC13
MGDVNVGDVNAGTSRHAGATDRIRVVVLGSTGSIGTQAIDVIAANPDRFELVGLAAGGSRPDELADQAKRFGVLDVAVGDADGGRRVRDALDGSSTRVRTGRDAIRELVEEIPADVVLNALVGAMGLEPTLAALRSGARLALANKESLVAGGPLVLDAAQPGQIVPVDSEHSALAQCLWAGRSEEIARLVLTASGGPFRGWTAERLEDVTPEMAGAHPTWSMGPMNTLNSATLVNKGLELIEANLLFGIPYDRIDVTVHPQSIVHSMVTFTDGSTIAQASPPDMRLPISLALGWPDRVAGTSTPCDFTTAARWDFEPLDGAVFPAVDLARLAGTVGGSLPAVYNAANEIAAEAFLDERIAFPRIVEIVAEIVDRGREEWSVRPRTVDDALAADAWARARAGELVDRKARATR